MAELFSIQCACVTLIRFVLGIVDTFNNIIKLSFVYLVGGIQMRNCFEDKQLTLNVQWDS